MRRVAFILVALLTACASAPTAQTFRVMTYNIHAGKDAAGIDNLERVAALITSNKADIVLLQEVDRGTKRSGGVDQVSVLMRSTGLNGAFGKSLDYQGGDYGIAILSRWPIEAQETLPLPVEPVQERAGGSHEPRVALIVRIATPGGVLEVVDTHIDASHDDFYRVQEADDLAKAIAQRPKIARIAGGDFNAPPESPTHAPIRRIGLRDSWLECGKDGALTYPANTPVKRIDYVLLGEGFRCTAAHVLDTQASDHRPVVVDVAR